MNLIETITQQIQQEQQFLAWATKICPNLIEGHAFTLSDGPYLATTCVDYNRDKILTEWSQTFGTDGWLAEDEGKKINWTRTIDGVKLIIYNAKVLPPVAPRPVAVTEWPLQLTEGTTVCH